MEIKKNGLMESNDNKNDFNEHNIAIKDFAIETLKNEEYYDLKLQNLINIEYNENENNIEFNDNKEHLKSVSDYDDNPILSENKKTLFVKPKSSKYVKQNKKITETNNNRHNGGIISNQLTSEYHNFANLKDIFKPNSRSFTNLHMGQNLNKNLIHENLDLKNNLNENEIIEDDKSILNRYNTNLLVRNQNLRYILQDDFNENEKEGVINCESNNKNENKKIFEIDDKNNNKDNEIFNNENAFNKKSIYQVKISNGNINTNVNGFNNTNNFNDNVNIKDIINNDPNLITLGSIILTSKSEDVNNEKLKTIHTNSNSINLNINYIKPLRFNSKNISEGSEFYKLRYICRKLKEINRNGLKIFLDENNMLKPDNRQVIQFNRLFLMKMETSFFQFNLQKPQESYQTLKESEIIDNEEEFVEVLILFFGFNKFIIGEFISKNKGMNKGLCMLYFFMHKLNFENVDFLQAFRFLWQTIIPPKDTNLVLEIINVFTIVYEKDNPKFYSSDELYLLCSTIMALNTSLHKDLDTVKPLPLNDFIRMNVGLNPKYLEYVYKELKTNKLDFKNDFQENFVNLAIEIQKIKGENTNLNSQPIDTLNKNCKIINEIKESNYNSNSKLEIKRTKDLKNYNKHYEDDVKMLKEGEFFTKYGNKGDPHKRKVFLSDDSKYICWNNPTCSYFSSVKKIPILELKNCYFGIQQSDIFGKYKIGKEFESNCFSIVSSKRTIDLRHDSELIVKSWFKAIKNLISYHQIQEKIKKKELKSNSILIIDEIWKSTILPNWEKYRVYLNDEKFFSIDKENSFRDFFEGLILKSKNKIIEQVKQDISNFRYIWTLGIPEFIRNKIWKILIKNNLFINEVLFSKLIENFQLKNINIGNSINLSDNFNNILIDSLNSNFNKKLDQIISNEKMTNFNIIKENKCNENLSQNCLLNELNDEEENEQKNNKNEIINYKNDYRKKSIILLDKIQKSNELKISNDENNMFYKMVLDDINKAFLDLDICIEDLRNYKLSNYDNSNEINNTNNISKIKNSVNNEDVVYKLENFKKEVLIIILCFNNFRKDVSYNIDLTYLSLVISCNSENYFQAFVNLTNFVCGSYLIHFLKDSDKFIKTRINYFELIFKEYLPRLYDQFKQLGYSINLFFYDWIPSLFAKYFKIKTLNRLWDIYLIKKEIFVYEIALGILLFIEKDLRQCTFNELKGYLLSFNPAYCDDDFFEILYKIDLRTSFKNHITENSCIYEKNLLNDEYLNFK